MQGPQDQLQQMVLPERIANNNSPDQQHSLSSRSISMGRRPDLSAAASGVGKAEINVVQQVINLPPQWYARIGQTWAHDTSIHVPKTTITDALHEHRETL